VLPIELEPREELARLPGPAASDEKSGRNAIKLYVDNDNRPHREVFEFLGNSMPYELKLTKSDAK
jgi:hypothetical protein